MFKLIEIIKELSIEVTKPNIFQALVAKQYDMNTRFLKVTLMDCGNRIDVPNIETAKVVINAERKDGQSKGFDGVINEDGTVTVPLHSWMLELDGTVICDISVIDTATDDNKKLTTTSFTLIVEKAAYGGNDVTNDPQYDVLVELMENCQAANEAAQEALEKSNEANAKYEDCVEATENANNAANELESIKQELAEGGYIYSIKEGNSDVPLSFWVGTQEEYDAISEKRDNCFYIISDDDGNGAIKILASKVELLEERIETVEEKVAEAQRIESGRTVCAIGADTGENSTAAVTPITFNTPFNTLPVVTATLNAGMGGDGHTLRLGITGLSQNGFSCSILGKNSGEITVYWIAVGT